MNALSTHALELWRGGRRLCRELSFRAEAGQAVHLRGANGSGKTTLLRVLAGLATPESGDVYWNEQPLAEAGDDYRRALAWLGHSNGLKSNLTPIENLSVHLAMTDTAPVLGISDALTRLGIESATQQRSCASLSMGQQRRTALARVLLSRVPLWLLDEPMTSLDAEGTGLLAELLRSHLLDGGIAVFATHQPLDLGNCTVQSVTLGAAA